ncbi:cell wall-active antibiotics response protein LiaF [Metabacillus idriensis]|uniref:cell wall-active antibiotics response protein LiaF n=1 Tax=Metabacillus idriensis TaxID=324768 RepID=UPI00281309A8|nr:cell wall-active antibiotics response protein LiaF [Metabacillus idriensis]MDR0139348.1 cell wall-active antibiotics response protein LiaF [Metabacillus idriensis]
MLKKANADMMTYILLIGIVLLMLEVLFDHGGLIFFLIFSSICIYLGKKRLARKTGKLLFWFGLISLVITVMNLWAVKFLIFAFAIYLLFQYRQSKKTPAVITPEIKESILLKKEDVLYKKPLFSNNVFGQQTSAEEIYEWNDINIQSGIGDTIIDLSNTVLPKEECIIVIRNVIGNVKILLPYELDAAFQHSSWAGAVSIFEHREPKVFNQVVSYQTKGYENAVQKVKVVTSSIVGDLEVKRI